MRRALCVLGAAASHGELAFVYFEADDLRCWGLHRRPLRNLDNAFALTLRWIDKYEPMLAIVPNYDKGSRKGRRARAIIEMVASAAAEREIACIRQARPKVVTNKYHEAARLAAIYPQLAPRVPRPRRTWDSERHGILVFEAAAITHDWLWRNNQGTHSDTLA